ncbi:MAG: hypothetical protein KDC00_07955 [Flavobacteriales bacterium]|nr:hypothetical protein [Flavobacteriales bacterium]
MLGSRTRAIILIALLSATADLAAQRATDCIAFYDFETIDQFNGWDIGPFVDAQTPGGEPTGVIVTAWELADATAANANGYFPVPDIPIGNTFVQANDAADPCNCGMNDVKLTTPLFDLSDHVGMALEFRAFHEGTLGGGPAIVEARNGNDEWSLLDTIIPLPGAWQTIRMDLSAFDGLPEVMIRFRWSDGGGWASGFAMDDMCLRERFANDLTVSKVLLGDPTMPAFNMFEQTLPYRQLPVEQFGGLSATMEVVNNGTSSAEVDSMDVDLLWNGAFAEGFRTAGPGVLAPGEHATVQVTHTWTPTGAGRLTVVGKIPSDVPDDDESDNNASGTIEYTAAGWSAGYGAMSVDNDLVEHRAGGRGNFVLANRMEIVNAGSTAQGASVLLATSSNEGEEIRAILMDANFSFVDTSARRSITQEDIERTYNGEALYLPFSMTPELHIGDHFVGIQHLETGDEGNVEIALGGPAPLGGSVLLEGLAFDLTYLTIAPFVRLHLADVAVGLVDPQFPEIEISMHPSPADMHIQLDLSVPESGMVQVEVCAADGRVVLLKRNSGSSGNRTLRLDTSNWSSGSYHVTVLSERWHAHGSFIVAH